MIVLLIIQIISDLSLYFAIGFYLLALFGQNQPVFWLILCLPPCLYEFSFYKRRNNPIIYSLQKDRFIKGLRLLPLFALPALATFELHTLEQKALPWIIIYLFSNVLLLNLLRHNSNTLQNRRFIHMNLAAIVMCCFLCLEVSRVWLLNLLVHGLWILYHYLISPLLVAFSYLLSLVIWLFVRLIKGLTGSNTKITELDWSTAPVPNDLISIGSNLSWPTWISFLKPLFLMILLFGLSFYLYRHALQHSQQSRPSHNTSQHREKLPPTTSTRARLFNHLLAPQDPRLAIRFYYRKFLRLCQQQGIRIDQSATSTLIQQAAQTYFDPQKLHELHQLYIQARYSQAQPLPSDVIKIKKIYNDIKKGRP